MLVIRHRVRKLPSSPPCTDIQLTPSSLTSSPNPPDSVASFQQRFQHFQPELLQQGQEEEEEGDHGQDGRREGRGCQGGVSVHYSISYSSSCHSFCHQNPADPTGLQLKLPLTSADHHGRPADSSGPQLAVATAPAGHQLRNLHSQAKPCLEQGSSLEVRLGQNKGVREGSGAEDRVILGSEIPGGGVSVSLIPGNVIPGSVIPDSVTHHRVTKGQCSVPPGSVPGQYLSLLKENLVEGARSRRRDSLVCDV